MRKFLVFLAGLMMAVSALASEDGARVEFLDTYEAVKANYCLTDEPGYFQDCGAPHMHLAVVYLPRALAEMVLQHIQAGFRAGYAQDISPKDFFHGHLIMKNTAAEVSSPDALYDGFQTIVYHSAERLGRWEKEARQGLTADQRTPRSFLGWLDGSIQKAVDFVTPGIRLKSYEQAGTIYTEEIAQSRPELVNSLSDWTNFGGTPVLRLNVCRPDGVCGLCKFDWVANFGKIPEGRFVGPTGDKIDIFSRCRFDQDL